MEGRKKRRKKKMSKKYKISNNTTIQPTTIQPTTIQPTTMQQQDNLPPRISDSHFIHTQTVTCTTKHFGNDMIL